MYKIGDKVKIIANTNFSRNKIGDIGVVIEKGFSGNCRVQVEGGPTTSIWTDPKDMVLVKDKDMYKIGDKVVILNNDHSPHHYVRIGSVAEVVGVEKTLIVKGDIKNGASSQYISYSSVRKVEEVFEDQWHLNDGKTPIPDDADKLEKDGSVVAYRKRKQEPLKFGDMVTVEDQKEPGVFIRKDRLHDSNVIIAFENSVSRSFPRHKVKKV